MSFVSSKGKIYRTACAARCATAFYQKFFLTKAALHLHVLRIHNVSRACIYNICIFIVYSDGTTSCVRGRASRKTFRKNIASYISKSKIFFFCTYNTRRCAYYHVIRHAFRVTFYFPVPYDVAWFQYVINNNCTTTPVHRL